MDHKAYWKSDKLSNIVAGGKDTNPEGFDVLEFVRDLVAPVLTENIKVLDLGCGYGRLCRVFDPDTYLGADLNPNALALARQRYPEYRFEEVVVDQPYPRTDLCMAYTVFLHMDDASLVKILDHLIVDAGVSCIVVAEILGREWRRSGLPPVYNRDLEDYLQLFLSKGFHLTHAKQRVYKRYASQSSTKNTRLNGLVFERMP